MQIVIDASHFLHYADSLVMMYDSLSYNMEFCLHSSEDFLASLNLSRAAAGVDDPELNQNNLQLKSIPLKTIKDFYRKL